MNPPIGVRSSYFSCLSYEDHSSEPSVHSYRSPNRRIIRNAATPVKNVGVLIRVVINGIGVSSTISMSNTTKIMASRKNRRENGIRAMFFGSNPHSKGASFSRSLSVRMDRNHAVIKTTAGSSAATVVDRRSVDMERKRYVIF